MFSTIKQKGIIAIIFVIVSVVMLIVTLQYTSNLMSKNIKNIEEINEKLLTVTKIIKDHYAFIAKFEKAFIKNEKANLITDPTKCSLGKFISKLNKNELPQELRSKYDLFIYSHNHLHKLVKIYNEEYIKIDRKLPLNTAKAFLSKYAWLLKVANITMGKSEKIGLDYTRCDVGKYLRLYSKKDFNINDSRVKDIEKIYFSLNEPHKKLHEKVIQLIKLPRGNRKEFYLKEIYPLFKKLRNSTNKILENMDAIVTKNRQIEKLICHAFKNIDIIIDFFEKYREYLEKEKEDIKLKIKNTKNFVATIEVIIILISIIGIGIIVFIIKSTIDKIKKLEKVALLLASKKSDLTKRIAIKSNDEIGNVSKYIDNFIENIQNTINEAKKISHKNDTSANELYATAKNIDNEVEKERLIIKDLANKMVILENDMSNSVGFMKNTKTEINKTQNELKKQIVKLFILLKKYRVFLIKNSKWLKKLNL